MQICVKADGEFWMLMYLKKLILIPISYVLEIEARCYVYSCCTEKDQNVCDDMLGYILLCQFCLKYVVNLKSIGLGFKTNVSCASQVEVADADRQA